MIPPKIGLAIGFFGIAAASLNYVVLKDPFWRLATVLWVCYTIFTILRLRLK